MKQYLQQYPKELEILVCKTVINILKQYEDEEVSAQIEQTISQLFILFEYGANPNQMICVEDDYFSKDKLIPMLFIIIYVRQCSVAKDMIDIWRADINATSNHSSILHWAVGYSNNLSFVQYLIEEKRLNVNVKDSEGDTVINWAAEESKSEDSAILRYLLALSEVSYDYQNIRGETPLHAALGNSCWDQAESLLEKKVRTNLRVHESQHNACTFLLDTFEHNTEEEEDEDFLQRIALLKKIINNGYNIQENPTNQDVPTVEKMVKQIHDLYVRNRVLEALLFPSSEL